MATYYGTYGQKVQYLASDPSDPQIGQVWYNSTSAVLKVRGVTTAGTFASGGNLNTTRGSLSGGSGAGTQTAGLIFGGDLPAPATTTATEEYDGTSWTSVNGLNTKRQWAMGLGLQTAALGFGGQANPNAGPPPTANITATESYDGTNWTSVNSLNTARRVLTGFGTQTSALAAAGNPASTAVETWNGTSWTSGVSLTTGDEGKGSSAGGTQTAGIVFGGLVPGGTSSTTTESWNGSSWTTVGAMNTGRRYMSGCGTQTATVTTGGNGGPPGLLTSTESWNGSTWTTLPANLPAARQAYGAASGSPSTSWLIAGGLGPSNLNTTLEWTGPGVAETRTVTVS